MPPFIQDFDFYFSQLLRSAQTPWLMDCANALTDLTYGGLLWWVVAIILWKKHQKLIALELVVALALAVIDTSVLKHLFHRDRPTVLTLHQFLASFQTLTADNYSFPSGHTVSAFAAAGVLRLNFSDWKGNISLLIALLVGLARIFEGWHWPTDVLAGIVVGLITAWISIPVSSKILAKVEASAKI